MRSRRRGNFELAQQGRQRRAQLVRGITRESLLPLEFLVQAVEQPVERRRPEDPARRRFPGSADAGPRRPSTSSPRPSPSASPAEEPACKATSPPAAARSQNPTERPARIRATFLRARFQRCKRRDRREHQRPRLDRCTTSVIRRPHSAGNRPGVHAPQCHPPAPSATSV